MNKQLVDTLIEHARRGADNAYLPPNDVAEGASLLCDNNVIISACNIEDGTSSQVVIYKAASDGHLKFTYLCLWSESVIPYPIGADLDLIAKFSPDIKIIVANQDTYFVHKLHELLPIRRIND